MTYNGLGLGFRDSFDSKSYDIFLSFSLPGLIDPQRIYPFFFPKTLDLLARVGI